MSQVPQPQPGAVEHLIAYLEYDGLRHYILPGQRMTLGSSRASDIQLKGKGIQSHHAKIALHRDGQIWLRPLDGAMLRVGNERRTKPGPATPGDLLGVGLTIVHTGVVQPTLALQMRIGFQKLARYHRKVERAAALFLISAVLHLVALVLYVLLFLTPDSLGNTKDAPPRLEMERGNATEIVDLADDEPEPELEPEKEPAPEPMLETPEEVAQDDKLLEAEPLPTDVGVAGNTDNESDWLTNFGKKGTGDRGAGKGLQGVGEGGARLLEGAGKGAHETSAQLRRTGLEVAFVFDSTSSMGGIISESKARMEEILLLLGTLVPGTRIGMATYRDKGDQYLTRETKLGAGHYEILAFLESVTAAGGGDFAEAVDEGLMKALSWKWSRRATKILVLVGDAPPHPGSGLKRAARAASRFKAIKGKVYCLYTSPERETISSFRKIARSGGGEAFALDDSSILLEALVRIALKTSSQGARRILQNLEDARLRERKSTNSGQKAPVPALAQTLCEREPDRVIVESWTKVDRRELRALGPALQKQRLSKEGLFALSYILASVLDRNSMSWQAPRPEDLRPPNRGVPGSMRPWLFGSR